MFHLLDFFKNKLFILLDNFSHTVKCIKKEFKKKKKNYSHRGQQDTMVGSTIPIVFFSLY